MTAKARATLKASFEQGDKPQGSEFDDLIDSFISLSDTTAQTITSPVTFSGAITTAGLVLTTVTTAAASTISTGGAAVPATAMFVDVTVNGTAYVLALFNKK